MAPVTTAALAAGLAWGAMTVVGAIADWQEAVPRMRAAIDAWAGGNDWSAVTITSQLGRLAAIVPLTLSMLIMALGAGTAMSAVISRRQLPLGLTLPIGFGMLSLTVASTGLTGLFHPPALMFLAATMLGLGVRTLTTCRQSLATARQSLRNEPVAVAAAVLLAGILWVFLATLPDSSDDAFIYHWAAPEQYLLQHRLVGTPWHIHWQGPLGVNILYALALPIGGVIGIKCMHLAMLVAVMISLACLAGRLGAAPWTAVVLCVLSPAMAKHAWWSMNDTGVVLFWTAAILAPLVLPIRSLPGAVTTGVLAGCLVSVKYTAVFALIGLIAWLMYRRATLRVLLLIGGAAAAASAVWFGRTWLVTGNPFFPFASRSFGGLWWGPEYERAFHGYAAGVTPVAPLRLSSVLLTCREVLASPLEFGPALAALAPLGLAVFVSRGAGLACLMTLLAFLALLAERTNRFLLPLLTISATAAALSVAALKDRWPRMFARTWPVFLCIAVLNLGCRTFVFLVPEDWCYMAGRMSGPELMAARQTSMDDLRQWCAARLPGDSRILLTGSLLRFGFRQSIVSTHVVASPAPWRWAKESRTPEELARKWRQAGITHVADNIISSRYRQQVLFQAPEWDDRSLAVYRDFALRYLVEEYRSPHMDYVHGMFYLLRVGHRPHPPSRWTPTLPWTDSLLAESNRLIWLGTDRETAVGHLRRTLEKLQDVDSVVEQVASGYRRLGDIRRSYELNRALASHGFDGESGDYDLAAQESYFGNRRAAFASLRRRAIRTPSFHHQTDALLSVLYLNWATQERAKRSSLSCELLMRSLEINPNNADARATLVSNECGGAH